MSQSHAASPIHRFSLDAGRCLTKAFFSAVFGASVFGAASLISQHCIFSSPNW